MRGQHHFRKLAAGLVILGAAALSAACLAPPVQEMSDARQAITAAEDAGAASHAPDSLSAARALLNSAEAKLRGHQYREARRAAMEAKARALQALKASESLRPDQM